MDMNDGTHRNDKNNWTDVLVQDPEHFGEHAREAPSGEQTYAVYCMIRINTGSVATLKRHVL